MQIHSINKTYEANHGILVDSAAGCITIKAQRRNNPIPFGALFAVVLAFLIITLVVIRIRRFLKKRRTRSNGP